MNKILMMDIEKLIRDNGIRGVILTIIILVLSNLIKSGWLTKWVKSGIDSVIKTLIRRNLTNKPIVDMTESVVINHDIFNYIDYWCYSKVPIMNFSSEYRTQVFRRYLTIYLKSYKSGLREMITSGEYKKMDSHQIKRMILDTINRIIFNYETECRSNDIPDIIINKMKIRNNDNIDIVMPIVESMLDSNFYDGEDNYLKIYSILNIFSSMLDASISKSESVCSSINGELKGFKIKIGGKEYRE